MQNLEYIDKYFKGECSQDEISQFEQKIMGDPAFAEEVAFYVNAMQAAQKEKEEKKAVFGELYRKGNFKDPGERGIVRKLLPYLSAAAIVAALIVSWFLFLKPASPQKLADEFITERFNILDVTMGNNPDTLQTALHFYNDGKQQEALQLIEKYIQSDTSRYNAKMYAGIVSLRLKDYDKALSWFNQLATYRLEVNQAVFYQALTLIKRNLPGDIDKARLLLKRVVGENLGEKETAQRLLDRM